MKNLKLNNKNLLFTLLLSGALTLTGCGSKRYTERDLNFSRHDSIESTIKTISDVTTIDEDLDSLTYDYLGENINIIDALQEYERQYDADNISRCNYIMENVGTLLLKQQVMETLGIDLNDTVQFRILDKQTAGFDVVYTEYVAEIIYDDHGTLKVINLTLKDEAERMAINTYIASHAGFESKDRLDKLYDAVLEFTMTEGSIDEDCYTSKFSSEKIGEFVTKK